MKENHPYLSFCFVLSLTINELYNGPRNSTLLVGIDSETNNESNPFNVSVKYGNCRWRRKMDKTIIRIGLRSSYSSIKREMWLHSVPSNIIVRYITRDALYDKLDCCEAERKIATCYQLLRYPPD
jgi:hypothetical protein